MSHISKGDWYFPKGDKEILHLTKLKLGAVVGCVSFVYFVVRQDLMYTRLASNSLPCSPGYL